MKQVVNTCELLGIEYIENVPLSRYTMLRVGGSAAMAAWPKTEKQFIQLVMDLQKHKIAFMVIGRANQLVCKEEGYSGCIVFSTKMTRVSIEENLVKCSAGVNITALAYQCSDPAVSLSGLEIMYGDTRTIGGLAADCSSLMIFATSLMGPENLREYSTKEETSPREIVPIR